MCPSTPVPCDAPRIAAAIAAARTFHEALEALLTKARRLTRAEAGTIYLREGERLAFAVAHNDALARAVGPAEMRRLLTARPLSLSGHSIASYVALTRAAIDVPDAYAIPDTRPYLFDETMDQRTGYRTQSVLTLPLRDARGSVFGVLQLINALGDRGEPVPFGESALTAVLEVLNLVTLRPDRPAS